jgi:hypothetical protein
MKISIKLQLFALLGLFIFTSCVTSNNVVSGNLITKRKYNKGFHFNFEKRYKTAKSEIIEEEKESLAAKFNETDVMENREPEEVSHISINEIEKDFVLESEIPKDLFSEHQHNVIAPKNIIKQSNNSKFTYTKNHNLKQSKKIKKLNSKAVDSDVKLILLVVLAFLISPLAMYISDPQTDMWFILDLILYLFWIGFLISPGLGLVGLASVVIALLRIFGMI